jgi:hypothetical protein
MPEPISGLLGIGRLDVRAVNGISLSRYSSSFVNAYRSSSFISSKLARLALFGFSEGRLLPKRRMIVSNIL